MKWNFFFSNFYLQLIFIYFFYNTDSFVLQILFLDNFYVIKFIFCLFSLMKFVFLKFLATSSLLFFYLLKQILQPLIFTYNTVFFLNLSL